MGENEGATKEAEGLASSFVTALGLVDIFFGALTVYGASLFGRETLTHVFPPTGNPIADLVLMVSAAALAGKIVTLFAAIIRGFVDLLMKSSNKTTQLKTSLEKWWKTSERSGSVNDPVPVDQAIATLRVDAPALARESERVAKSADICAGGALIAVLYAFGVAVAKAYVLTALFGIAALVLFGLACLHEADYIATLRDGIGALRPSMLTPPER